MERYGDAEGAPRADGITDEEVDLRPSPLLVVQLHGRFRLIREAGDLDEGRLYTVSGECDPLGLGQTTDLLHQPPDHRTSLLIRHDRPERLRHE